MENTVKRIVYCEPAQLPALPPDRVDVLDDELPVVAATDDVLLALAGGFGFLYFSREDYDEAVRGLSPEQVREVFTTRRAAWSPDAAGHSLAWIAGELRRCLCLSALALKATHPAETTALLQANFEHTIQCLAALKGSPPLGILMPPEVFEIALIGETRLCMEYTDLTVPGGPELAERRRQRAGTIAQIMARLGDEAFLEGLPYLGCKRGVNVLPLPATIREDPTLEEEGDLLTDWSGGTVLPWPHHDLAGLGEPVEAEEKAAVHVLYLDAGEYQGFAAGATTAQIERDFGERLAAAGNPDGGGFGGSAADHLNALVADELAFLWSLRDLFAALGRGDLAPELDPLIEEDIQAFVDTLQGQPSWIRDPVHEPGDALEALVAAEGVVRQSTDFFMKLEHDPRWTALRPTYERLLAIGSKLGELADARGRT